MQLGHGLKEEGDFAGAAAAYREAVRIAPAVADSWIHLAHLERGDREAAIAALSQAIAVDGGSTAAIAAMVALGARERLPVAVQQRIEADEGVHALSRYAAWREAQPVAAAVPTPDVLAVIDGRGAPAERIAVTRATLGDMPCLILGDGPAGTSADDAVVAACHILLVEAGTRIAPDAVAKLCAAVAETGAGAAYGDHDHWEGKGGGDIAFRDPCFQPMFDPVWFARAEGRPPCLLLTAPAAAPCGTWGALSAARLALPVAYAHVPSLLASRHGAAVPAEAAPLQARPAGEGAIQVIVQTRDAPEMLERCIGALLGTAARSDLLDIVIVDNRSMLPRTATLLARWAGQGIARIMPHDMPFNWALANNLAANDQTGGQGDAPHLLFLNNDVEMETIGWDTALRAGLAVDGVGALGALLLYPDGLIQHAGVVFGVGAGGPLHEGVGQPPAAGPGDRWRQPRLAAAVTGAWLAVTRTLFNTVGGFEEQLPVGYNDVDFCLRVRAAGQGVMQASHIVAVHHESATRGIAMSTAEQARDEADWAWMRARWGAALDLDPAYDPHWLREGRPFDGLHAPSADAVARWIRASARPHPWAYPPPA